MTNWIKCILSPRRNSVGNYRPKTLWDFFMRFYESDRERINMLAYIRENADCTDHSKLPSKKLMRRYLISMEKSSLLPWYLMEKYFEGKITIKE